MYVLGKGNVKQTLLTPAAPKDKSQKGLQKGGKRDKSLRVESGKHKRLHYTLQPYLLYFNNSSGLPMF